MIDAFTALERQLASPTETPERLRQIVRRRLGGRAPVPAATLRSQERARNELDLVALRQERSRDRQQRRESSD